MSCPPAANQGYSVPRVGVGVGGDQAWVCDLGQQQTSVALREARPSPSACDYGLPTAASQSTIRVGIGVRILLVHEKGLGLAEDEEERERRRGDWGVVAEGGIGVWRQKRGLGCGGAGVKEAVYTTSGVCAWVLA